MIAVIFGGHGFIGSHLARELASSGRYSRVVSADIASTPRFASQGVDYLYCDVREPIPDDLVPGATEIYNLAAIHVTPGHADREYYWTNISGAQNITEYARRLDIRKLFFTSSIAVYGPVEDETTEASPLKPDSPYGQSKLIAEQIHCQWQKERAMERKLVIVRPAVIFGFQEQGNFTRLARQLEKGIFVYPGRKDTIKACGYVKDLIASLEFSRFQNDNLFIYNFAFKERLTTEAICNSFCETAHFRRPRWVLPVRVVLIAGLLFEYLGKIGIRTQINRARVLKLFLSTNVVSRRLEAVGFQRRFDLNEALRDWQTYSASSRFE